MKKKEVVKARRKIVKNKKLNPSVEANIIGLSVLIERESQERRKIDDELIEILDKVADNENIAKDRLDAHNNCIHRINLSLSNLSGRFISREELKAQDSYVKARAQIQDARMTEIEKRREVDWLAHIIFIVMMTAITVYFCGCGTDINSNDDQYYSNNDQSNDDILSNNTDNSNPGDDQNQDNDNETNTTGSNNQEGLANE